MISDAFSPSRNTTSPIYQIRLQGHLGPQWTDYFFGMEITQESDGDTRLTGPIVDQSALHGLLRKVRDIGIPLISVICIGIHKPR